MASDISDEIAYIDIMQPEANNLVLVVPFDYRESSAEMVQKQLRDDLTLDSLKEIKKIKIGVPAHHLKLYSNFFAQLLSGNFSEGIEFGSRGFLEYELPDDAFAVMAVFLVLFCQEHRSTPAKTMGDPTVQCKSGFFKDVSSITTLLDKYLFTENEGLMYAMKDLVPWPDWWSSKWREENRIGPTLSGFRCNSTDLQSAQSWTRWLSSVMVMDQSQDWSATTSRVASFARMYVMGTLPGLVLNCLLPFPNGDGQGNYTNLKERLDRMIIEKFNTLVKTLKEVRKALNEFSCPRGYYSQAWGGGNDSESCSTIAQRGFDDNLIRLGFAVPGIPELELKETLEEMNLDTALERIRNRLEIVGLCRGLHDEAVPACMRQYGLYRARLRELDGLRAYIWRDISREVSAERDGASNSEPQESQSDD